MTERILSIFVSDRYCGMANVTYEGRQPYDRLTASPYPMSPIKWLMGGRKKTNKVLGGNLGDMNFPIIDLPEVDLIEQKATGRKVRLVFADTMWNKGNGIYEKLPPTLKQSEEITALRIELQMLNNLVYEMERILSQNGGVEVFKKGVLTNAEYLKKIKNAMFNPYDSMNRGGNV